MKYAKLSLCLFLGASFAGATTFTVTPNGQYPTVCSAVAVAQDGDTVLVDANHGIPYVAGQNPLYAAGSGKEDCVITQNNFTIRGINGRPILDASKPEGPPTFVQKGILVIDGHDVLIDNLELRNANPLTNPNSAVNAAGIRIEDGSNTTPKGGNVTVRRCYIHDNGNGILSGNSGPGIGQWFSPNPFLLFEYDDFSHNSTVADGQQHNMYIGADTFGKMKFTLRYSKSRDAYAGHDVKTRAPFNYILYNVISDKTGFTSYELDFPLGGTTYVVGNIIYKSAVDGTIANNNMMIYADRGDNASSDPEYGVPNQDLHFLNNIVVDNNARESNAFVNVICANASSATCAPPNYGPPLTTPAEVKGNLFIGQVTNVSNQPDAITKYNLVRPYSDLAARGFIPQ
ncbi:MAG: hypothetical protein ABI164_11150 [Acidobacteriaceae bacterium]